MSTNEVLKLALEALIRAERDGYWSRDTSIAGEALREALAEQPAQQEPKFVRNVGGIPCITLAEHEHLMRSRPQAREPLTDEMVVAAARMLSDRQAAACNVDCGDMWKLHGNDFLEDARAALQAAHGIKENT